MKIEHPHDTYIRLIHTGIITIPDSGYEVWIEERYKEMLDALMIAVDMFKDAGGEYYRGQEAVEKATGKIWEELNG